MSSRRMIGGGRMVGGAETALLTLDDGGGGGGEGATAPGGMNFVSTNNNAPAKFIGIKPTFASIKTIVNKFNEIVNPNKKDLRMAASEIFDLYSYSTPQARGILDQSVPVSGFINELGHAVKLKPVNAKNFFMSLVDLIAEVNPDLQVAQPVTEQQATVATGSGNSGCGCCNTCGGAAAPAPKADTQAKPADTVKALAAPAPDKQSKLSAAPPANSIVNNILSWIKKKRESSSKPMLSATKKETLEDVAKKNDKKMPPLAGSGRVEALIAKGKKLAGGAHMLARTQRKQMLPGRVQKLRARLANEESSDSGESSSDSGESSSDEEAKGSGSKRAPNKRAVIVKKVMKERGVSMIEASKIVKKEELY